MESISVHVASERQMRGRRDTLLDDPFEAEMAPLIFTCDSAEGSDGMVTRPTPYVYVKDLPGLIVNILERHYQ